MNWPFFPLIYWPIVAERQPASPQALAKIDAYMKNGGTVLFDTRDVAMAPPGPGGENRSARHDRAARYSPRSIFPNWSRSRAITF